MNKIKWLVLCIVSTSNVVAQQPNSKTTQRQSTSIYKSLQLAKPTKVKNYISTRYDAPYNTLHQVWYETFAEEKFLEKMAKVLNSVFKINKPLTLSCTECNTVNAFYDPEKKELILCYELLEFIKNTYESRYNNPDSLGTKIGEVLTFIYFHEIGHALIDNLDVPLTGKEEDAADYFAFYILASNQVAEGVKATMEGATFFKEFYELRQNDTTYIRLKSEGKEPPLPFWDEHSFEMQRFYTLFSLIYGSNPIKYDYLINDGYLGYRRPQNAVSEYGKIKRGWDRVLKNYIKWHK